MRRKCKRPAAGVTANGARIRAQLGGRSRQENTVPIAIVQVRCIHSEQLCRRRLDAPVRTVTAARELMRVLNQRLRAVGQPPLTVSPRHRGET